MANVINSPNMGLPVPVVGVEPGPQWASDINNSLEILDGHNHTPGYGVAIPSSGININADLLFNQNNATLLRSARFAVQTAAISQPTDLACLYAAGTGGDLYFNDGNGNQIRVTQSGSVAGSAGTITGLPSGTASASFSAVSGTFVFQQATNTAANLDVGSVIVRYPGSYPTPSGNYIALEAPSSLASGYALTLPALPAQTNVMALGSTGTISSITYDAVGQGMTSTGANPIANARTRATGTTVAAGGVAVSASSGSFTTTSNTTRIAVTNLSVTITSTGRPVFVGCMGNSSGTVVAAAGSAPVGAAVFINNATTSLDVSLQNLGNTGGTNITSISVPASSIWGIDFPSAGTYTYRIQVNNGGTSSTVTFTNVVLVAYEL